MPSLTLAQSVRELRPIIASKAMIMALGKLWPKLCFFWPTTNARWLIKSSKDADFRLVFIKKQKIASWVGAHGPVTWTKKA